jgi:hypothetical protein
MLGLAQTRDKTEMGAIECLIRGGKLCHALGWNNVERTELMAVPGLSLPAALRKHASQALQMQRSVRPWDTGPLRGVEGNNDIRVVMGCVNFG